MIDRIAQTVRKYLNTDGRGNFSPSDFDTILHHKVQERNEALFFEVNRQINRQNRGLINGGLENVAEHLREKIEHYLEPEVTLAYSGGTFSLPSDLRYFDVACYNGEPIELCKSLKSEATCPYHKAGFHFF